MNRKHALVMLLMGSGIGVIAPGPVHTVIGCILFGLAYMAHEEMR